MRRSVSSALLSKELRRFTASPNYMLNCGMGVLLMPLAGFTLLWKGADIRAALGAALGAEAGAYLSVMLAAPSVSLEGKSLWLLQSLPVTPWQVLRAKLGFQLLLTAIPVLVCLVCAVIALPMAAAETALMAVLTLLFVVFSALLGLTLGLKMPHLHWTSELAPIKQSACVAITLLGGWGYALVLLFGFLLAGQRLGAAAYMGIFAVLTLLACVWLYRWLKKKGVVLFAAL